MFRNPGRPRTSACFCAKARLMHVTSHQEDKKNAAELQKKGKFETLTGFEGLKTYLLTGLRNHCFKQQKENQVVITKKNSEPNQKLTEIVVGE